MLAQKPVTCRRVLVVEDDSIACQAMRALLRRWGYEPTECTTAADAFAEVRRAPPSCVLLDILLPDFSGLELLKSIRSRGSPIKVVVITASHDPQVMRELTTLRPDILFHKPLDVARLKRWMTENL